MTQHYSTMNPTIAKVVERQLRNWELARAQRIADQPAAPTVQDFLCISRMLGAGGSAIAGNAATKLGWPMFDRELLDAMAGNDAVRRQIYASMDERDLSWCEEMLRSLMQPEFVKNDYFHRLSETALAIARQGHAVFVGRAIDLILPRDVGLRVRLIAPDEVCVHNYAERARLTLERARDEIRRIEQDRDEFVRRHFGADANDPARFDLLINLGVFSANQAVELIVTARNVRITAPGAVP